MEKTSEYLFVSSTDSMNLFPNNNGSSFRVLMPPHFSRKWEIGLKEIYIKISPKLPPKHILICLDQIGNSLCSYNELGILRSVCINRQILNIDFNQTYYFRFTQYNIEYLHIFLTNEIAEHCLKWDVRLNVFCIAEKLNGRHTQTNTHTHTCKHGMLRDT